MAIEKKSEKKKQYYVFTKHIKRPERENNRWLIAVHFLITFKQLYLKESQHTKLHMSKNI